MKNPSVSFVQRTFHHWLTVVLLLTGLARAAERITECESVFTFTTGKNDGVSLRPGSSDPYFDAVTRNFPAGSALVVGTLPTGWLPNAASPDSAWIGPASDGTSAAGTYIYRLVVVTPCAGADVRGRFAVSDRGGLTINGVATDIVTPANGAGQWTDIAFNDLPKGTNRIDFVCTNVPTILGGESATGLRAEVTVTATCCPCIVIDCPPDITITTCADAVPVVYPITAVNHCGPAPTLTCNPPSGSVFTVGSHSVICDARDTLGHVSRCVFKVNVIKQFEPPSITCPAGPILLTANNNCQAELPALSATVTNPCGPPGSVAISQMPAPGTLLPVGLHTVKLRACQIGAPVIGLPLCSECEVQVQVCAPTRLLCPEPITVHCAPGGTPVRFSVMATDPCGSGTPLPVTCVPPSGSLFPVGTTLVTCSATNSCGVISTCSFPVTVTGNTLTATLTAGLDDAFAGATEPSQSGLCLTQTGLLALKPFDEPASTRRWGQTFSALPENIVGAKLTIAMAPLGPFAGLDRIYLGLKTCQPATWAAIKAIASLPGANSSWNNNGRVIFTLDLAALPGGGNLLETLNLLHRLDIVTDPATRVDFCRLELQYCAPVLPFSQHILRLSNAMARYSPFGIELLPPVPNAKPDWVFGVELPIDDILQFDFPDSLCNSVGSHEGLVTDWKPNADTVATLKFTQGSPASRTDITMTQPQNTSGKSVEVYRQGQLVTRRFYSGTNPSGVSLPDGTCLESMGFSTSAFFAHFATDAPVTLLPGGDFISGDPAGTVTGDSIRLGFVVFIDASNDQPTIEIGGILPLLHVHQIRTVKSPFMLPTPCVQIDCPRGVDAICQSPEGTVVQFTVSAQANCGKRLDVTCTPPSGSVFAPGVTWVVCVAQDELGNRDRCTFPVVVRDTTPPVITLPRRVTAPCVSPRGAIVEYTVSATDDCGTVKLDCQPPSGSVFPVGTTMVTCVATDEAGNQTRREFPVVVTGDCGDRRCLVLHLPEDLRVPCNTPGGAVVRFDVTALDQCSGGPATVTCVPPSGSPLPVGRTIIVCTAKSGEATATGSFAVEVVDETPPEIACPEDIEVKSQNGRGAVVRFTVSAKDDCTINPRVRCRPPSGSVFPVGETQVQCEANDGHGNLARCSFKVTVLPPKPFLVQPLGANLLRLRWTGDAQPQFSDLLGQGWMDLPDTSMPDGEERVLDVQPTLQARFFRILPRLLAPEPDADGDGVPDARDRCPDSPAGVVVDANGCTLEEIVEDPKRLTRDFDELYLGLLKGLASRKILAGVVDKFGLRPLNGMNSPMEALRHLDFSRAQLNHSNLLSLLRQTLASWPNERAARIRMLLAQAIALDAANADVRNEDHELNDLDDFEADLARVIHHGEALLGRLNGLQKSTLGKQRVTIRSVDSRRGLVVLADGRRVLVRIPGALADEIAFGPGSQVELDLHDLGNGNLGADLLNPVARIDNLVPPGFLLSTVRFRLVPVGQSGPLDIGTRLHPRAYFWGFTEGTSKLFLEKGMAFAAVKSAAPQDPSIKSWLRIRVDQDNDGIYGTSFAESLDDTDSPVVLGDGLPLYKFMGLEVAEMRAKVVNGVTGTPFVVRTETYTMEIRDTGDYAEALYNRTIFELPDRPDHSAFQKARVTDVISHFPLTLANDNFTFASSGFGAGANSSTYPDVINVGLNQDFAVHWDEPAYQIFGALDEDVGTALAYSVIHGKNHGHTYVYRCRTPHVVHDRLRVCPGTDTYYRIPFFGPLAPNLLAGWNVSQGNNGSFTHKGDQKYAFDFPASAGRSILAARGGTVLFVRNTACFSCWNPNANNGDGACQNCTGNSAANTVTIQHDDGTRGRYFHFQKGGVNVVKGQRIYRGDILGEVGTTGCSTGNHLHFDVTENPDSNVTVVIRFEAYDDDGEFRECYIPPSQSEGLSNNKPWYWPF